VGGTPEVIQALGEDQQLRFGPWEQWREEATRLPEEMYKTDKDLPDVRRMRKI
jgi:hypothetical protein